MSEVGFGYIEFDLCTGCSTPRHLFACSTSQESTLCAECWGKKFYFSSYDMQSVLDEFTKEKFPVLANEGVEVCVACSHPFHEHERWQSTFAYLGDATTIVKVHVGCANNSSCENCETLYAMTTHRRTRFVRTESVHQLSYNLFVDYSRINRQDFCTHCLIEYMEDNGGSDSFFTCPACESHTHTEDSLEFGGTWYCESCHNDNAYECNNCGCERWSGDDHDCEDDDDSLIHSHSYRPSPFFYGSGKYHFGFELEVESRRNNRYDGARMVQESLGARVYLKEDGSISDGFEIVTHPHTLEVYQQEFDWRVLDKLKDDGYRSWNTMSCGLHVHVSRSAFGNGDPWEYNTKNRSERLLQRQSHELRFMKLVYDNQRQVERIAGRSNNSYATFEDKGDLVRKVKFGHQGNGRYSAINTENDDTIEVRVFKGSLRKERVLSAIEFVHASVEYTRTVKVTSKNRALSWLKFAGYVSANAEMYPNLVTIMSESFAGDSNPDEN